MPDAIAKPLTPEEQFRENIRNRVLKDAADLMPREVLDKLIEAAVKEALISPRRELKKGSYGSYSSDYDTKESWLCEVVRPIIEAQLIPQINQYFADHKDEIQALIKEKLELGMIQTLYGAVNRLFSTPLVKFQEQLNQSLQEIVLSNHLKPPNSY